jgi:ATP/maltotriose-dependent transcriptional regulator MalT/DNA-binding SARP family transcriptional activator
MRQRRAVIITAPAGYGKTTLMVTALHEYKSEGCRVCWYRLDEDDRDLAVFYTHLVETLFPEREGLWNEPRGHLANCGDITAQYQYLNALFCQELWAYPDLKTLFVFDDFQHILDTPAIISTTQFFIDNLPDNCAIFISSRHQASLLTGKRALERNILEIAQSELCFSEEELAVLIEEQVGIIPEQGLLHKIMLHTEGWPAGIVLICQVLANRNAGRPLSAASSFLDQPDHKELLFQYILIEVLKTVDARLLQFLTKAVMLPEFTLSEAAAIFGEQNAAQLLEECEQKGLFIQKTFGPETTYRFHSLFQDALRQIQPRFLSPEEIRRYHLKAAAYYLDRRAFDLAIEHFITCGDVDSAVALVARESARLIGFESVEQLRLWFKLLPEAVVAGNGHLLYIKSFIYYQRDIDGALDLLEQALAHFEQANNGTMQFHALVAMAHLHALRNDLPGIDKIQSQMSKLSAAAPLAPLENMRQVFDFTIAVWKEQLARGLELSRGAHKLVLTDEWQWVLPAYSCIMYFLLGDLGLAEQRVQEALKLDLLTRAQLLKGYAQVFYSIVLQLKGEEDTRMLNELLMIGDKYGNKYLLGQGKRMAAMTSYRQHNLEDALELLDASTYYFEELGNTALASSNRLTRCLWLCHQGNPADLLAEARKPLQTLTTRPSGLCLQEIGLSVFGAIAREAGDYKLADRRLTAAVRRARSKGAKQILAGSCLHLAKLCYDTGDANRGEDFLRQAFDLAEENKYVMFWDLHFPTLVEMAVRCVKHQIHASYAQALIARYYGSEAAAFLARNAALTATDCLRDFADSFLSRYGIRNQPPAPRISVTLLGRFSISVNGIAIPKSEWKTRKIAGILKYLVVYRERTISRARLVEVFWPGNDKKWALISLRAALYELKKVLRKYGLEAEGKISPLSEKRDSLEVLTGCLLAVDADKFLAHFEDLKKLPANISDRGRKKTILERMVALYRGDFLEEDDEDWVFAQREELRSVYFESVIELANIYIINGDRRKAEKLLLNTLAMDLYNEDVCLCLLKLYIATNQRGRAVKFYSSFADRFERELGIKPAQELAAAIKE